MITSVLYLPTSRPQVFTALTAYAKYQEWLPGCEQSLVVSTKGAMTEADLVLNAPKRMALGLRFQADEGRLVRFELTRSKDLKTYAGLYRLVDADDGKGTVMFAELDLEVRGIPRFLSDGPAKKSVREAGEALRKHLQSAGVRSGAAPLAAAPAAPARKRARRILRIVQNSGCARLDFPGKTLKLSGIDKPGDLFPGDLFPE